MAAGSTELFPESPRVIYKKAPLIEVICQVRFPSLLSIESKPPVEFQEQIRSYFPLLERGAVALPSEVPKELAQMIQAGAAHKTFRFLTEDRSAVVTLAPDFLSLATTNYTKWEDFRENLRVPLSALNEIYNPSFFSRVGLRYKDRIDRTILNLGDTPWSKLLRPEILGELSLPEFEKNVDHVANRLLQLRMPDGRGSIVLRHGLGEIKERKELCYIIDIDLFTEKRTEVANAESTLDHYNRTAGRAFRWIIADFLRDKLDPTELAET